MNLPELPALASPIRVYYYDTDAGGVVHNIAYLRFIEEARTRLAEHLGLSLEEMARGDAVPVVARTEIDYLKPAKLGDRLTVSARITALRKSSFDLAFEITRDADSNAIARCVQTMVCVRLPAGKPVRSPAPWREHWPHLAR